jgi:hypothetical protein
MVAPSVRGTKNLQIQASLRIAGCLRIVCYTSSYREVRSRCPAGSRGREKRQRRRFGGISSAEGGRYKSRRAVQRLLARACACARLLPLLDARLLPLLDARLLPLLDALLMAAAAVGYSFGGPPGGFISVKHITAIIKFNGLSRRRHRRACAVSSVRSGVQPSSSGPARGARRAASVRLPCRGRP